MSTLTKKNVERFNKGDITDAEFYKVKGIVAVFEQATKEEIFNAQHADCDECFEVAIAQLVKYILEDKK